ncbi:hypothetical protein COEREDRAFT_80995 [Coemansia reversa NRRL 1564]|uniref:gamma-glutamylcyclotransferase n=1 Tax=Coemansia reversa (strain ATCC 12441 / NRRL 1564) TaxID=763665 RepID=A0A2G5BC79_COERN|nr:hypothetical protein COEREDRAFT_80995 [Coemansia reversa NRRL 1564]|eukprot:PIA16624.1 hypothetical protein COEREDRAFT_80995 [Coemansia reversa NRRL 1564]
MADAKDNENPLVVASSNNHERDMLYYLGYGSNMSSKVLSGRRHVYPVKSLPVTVSNYQLTFEMEGLPYWEPGFGVIRCVDDDSTVVPETNVATTKTQDSKPLQTGIDSSKLNTSIGGSDVDGPLHGVAFLITQEEMDHIVNTEGGSGNPNVGYRLIEVECTTYDGMSLRAVTLVSTRRITSAVLHPSPRYRGILIEGANEHGLAPEYIQLLEEVQPYEPKKFGQRVAKFLVTIIFAPLMIPNIGFALMALAFGIKVPLSVITYQGWVTRLVWHAHDWIFAPVFGKGC